MDTLVEEDVRNNSAWSHRYFVVWGAEELELLEGKESWAKGERETGGGGEGKRMNRRELFDDIKTTQGKGVLKADERVVEREIKYTKEKIGLAPQNPSPWNYLKGVLRRAGRDLSTEQEFCESFVRPRPQQGTGGVDDVVGYGIQPTVAEATEKSSEGAEIDFLGESVRSSHAIDWLAEIYAEQGEQEKAVRALESLGRKWDPIRKNYWDYRVKLMREGKYVGT